MALPGSTVNGAHSDGINQQYGILGVIGTLGTSDTQGTAKTLPIGVDPLTGALYTNNVGALTPLAVKIYTSGSITYIAEAAPNSNDTDSVWRAKKIDTPTTGTITITWAGTAGFNQPGTNLTALTYA